MSSSSKHCVVVGAGVSGLSAAYYLHKSNPDADITLVDAADQVGGKIRSVQLESTSIDLGADAFLARSSELVSLCSDLGLSDRIISPATSQAYIYCNGGLHSLPSDLSVGIPTNVRSVRKTGLVSTKGQLRMLRDYYMARTDFGRDASLGRLIRTRLGDEVFENLVDPLMGGIHAGTCDHLSVNAIAPQVANAARTSKSLMKGLRKDRRERADPSAPTFYSLDDGMTVLPSALFDFLTSEGARFEFQKLVTAVEFDNDGCSVELDDGKSIDAEAVIATVPSFVTADWVEPVAPNAANDLRSIEHVSIAMTVMVYDVNAWSDPRPGSGFLVAASEKKLVTAVSWATQKWPQMFSNPNQLVLRVSVGRRQDQRGLEFSDEELGSRIHSELTEIMGLVAPPLEVFTQRWNQAFPQYDVGHEARLSRIDAELAQLSRRFAVAGASYRGIGIPSCVRHAKQAADQITKAWK